LNLGAFGVLAYFRLIVGPFVALALKDQIAYCDMKDAKHTVRWQNIDLEGSLAACTLLK